ncbi:MAG: peptidylprolyl isomerase [Bacteroidales bacterium]
MQAQNNTEKMLSIQTPYGQMLIKLYNETPKHRDNFLKLVKENFYDSTLFHRVINTFMIQGGDPDSKNTVEQAILGSGDVGYTVPAEILPEKFHKKGALAAARQGDEVNPRKASSGCQFYIAQGQVYTPEQLSVMESNYGFHFTEEQKKAYTTIGGVPHLDGEYTVFGEIVSGLDVIDKISVLPTDKNDRPLSDIPMVIKLVEP